ncbi:cell wall-binding repeat-containing protein [Ornithinimicrobium faecis]|uniref:Cell wall-binding repeat-containing protein n=1 Tax=Ornithinimicrobium faecis TaxID=2934158 RepID=A0ABY4YW94_9MICO|nr:cell wall-binding repeat-containing protein [Ornithinimicrobium sp. HY1793]USQ80427.1 cell wall-binding repeat-containing protein [Ornithinimicrobium sp. HY1793]
MRTTGTGTAARSERRSARRMPSRTGAVLLAGVLALGLAGPALADAPMPDDRQEESADPVAPAADPVLTVPLDRLGGTNRYETSVEISSAQFASADTVYLARADVFADAIAAGSLRDGPVLLVPQCKGIPHVVADEIERLDPTEVVALGGPGSICEDTLQEAAKGREAVRLGGDNRFETAALIAQRAFPNGSDTVYLAEQVESVDAVAGGTLTDGPILLVANGSKNAPSATIEAIRELDPDEVVALGGKLVVTTPALADAAEGRTTLRVAGEDRYATSAAIAQRAFPEGSSRTYLANGRSVADSVVGGVLTRGPILLVPDNCRVPSEPVWRRLGELPPEKVVALGGQQAVCTEQLQTGGRLSVFSAMESGDTARLYDLLTKSRAVNPERYAPSDLVSWRGTSHRLRPETATMLQELFDGAAAAGHPSLWVNSSYRSYNEQQVTYDYWVRTVGKKRADMISAKPGHSEHQLGLAVDVAGTPCGNLYDCFGDTPEGKWVAANAHRYGFIIRYPEGGTGVTGYDYEPWHLRYVGPRAAWMMHVRDEIYWDKYQPRAVSDGTF